MTTASNSPRETDCKARRALQIIGRGPETHDRPTPTRGSRMSVDSPRLSLVTRGKILILPTTRTSSADIGFSVPTTMIERPPNGGIASKSATTMTQSIFCDAPSVCIAGFAAQDNSRVIVNSMSQGRISKPRQKVHCRDPWGCHA